MPVSPWIGSSITAAVRSLTAAASRSGSSRGTATKPGTSGANGSCLSGCGVADSAPIVRPWNAPSRTTISPPRRCRRASLIAASFASAPELHRKTRAPGSKDAASRAASRVPGSCSRGSRRASAGPPARGSPRRRADGSGPRCRPRCRPGSRGTPPPLRRTDARPRPARTRPAAACRSASRCARPARAAPRGARY